MSKLNHGLIWSNQHADGSITVGFTQQCINEALQECFHVFPAETKEVREKGPLLVLETNDGLQSIKAPFAGKVAYFNPKARNFPDRIKESETIVTIHPPGFKAPAPAPKMATKYVATPTAEIWDQPAAPPTANVNAAIQGWGTVDNTFRGTANQWNALFNQAPQTNGPQPIRAETPEERVRRALERDDRARVRAAELRQEEQRRTEAMLERAARRVPTGGGTR